MITTRIVHVQMGCSALPARIVSVFRSVYVFRIGDPFWNLYFALLMGGRESQSIYFCWVEWFIFKRTDQFRQFLTSFNLDLSGTIFQSKRQARFDFSQMKRMEIYKYTVSHLGKLCTVQYTPETQHRYPNMMLWNIYIMYIDDIVLGWLASIIDLHGNSDGDMF